MMGIDDDNGEGTPAGPDDKPARQYEAGDCVAVEIGEITLRDGRKVQGVVLTFPAGPPPLPISVVWEEEPLRLVRKS